MFDTAPARWRQPLRYALVGVVNTIVGLAVIHACKYGLQLADIPANLAGYVAGLTVSFLLNSSWTFGFAGARLPAIGRFLLAFAACWTANMLVVMTLLGFTGVSSFLAHAAGMPVYTVSFYLLSRSFAFRADAGASR